MCAKSRASLVVLRPPLCAVACCAVHYNKAVHLGRSNDVGDLSAVDKNASPSAPIVLTMSFRSLAMLCTEFCRMMPSPDVKVSDLLSYFL